MKGSKQGLHVRASDQRVNDMAVWEVWDGDFFIVGVFGGMSAHGAGAIAEDLATRRKRNLGFDWILPPDDR